MTHVIRMTSATGQGLELKQYEDILFPNVGTMDPERGIELTKTFQYRHGDIVQCSYPKCGFHWIGNMIWKLKSFQPTDRPRDEVLELAKQAIYDNQIQPRIICTHFKPSRLYLSHIENKGNVVLILRNPKDVLVSWYHHLRNSVALSNKQTWDEFFQSFISGEMPWGSYFDYLGNWERVLKEISDGKSKLEVGVFYYEEFQQNPYKNLARLNSYLNFKRDEEYLKKIIGETTLPALKERYMSPEFMHPFNTDSDGISVIFRKGQVGDWKHHLTVAQSETIDALLNKTLQHGIIKFKYEI